MAEKQSQQVTKDIGKLLKQLTATVPSTSNAAEYGKFLRKTLEKAQTFDTQSATYVDYVATDMKPKVAKTSPTASVPTAKSADAKKRTGAEGTDGTPKAKKPKSGKSDAGTV